MKSTRQLIVVFAALLALGLGEACHHQPRSYRPVVNPEFVNLTKEQAFQRAEDFYTHRKWSRARSYYQHVYETYPSDPLG